MLDQTGWGSDKVSLHKREGKGEEEKAEFRVKDSMSTCRLNYQLIKDKLKEILFHP